MRIDLAPQVPQECGNLKIDSRSIEPHCSTVQVIRFDAGYARPLSVEIFDHDRNDQHSDVCVIKTSWTLKLNCGRLCTY